MTQDALWRLATNGQMSWQKKVRERTRSKLCCATGPKRRSRQAESSSATSETSSFVRRDETDGRSSFCHPRNGVTKNERWKHLEPTLARSHLLVRNGGQWCCETCGRYASDGASKAKLARTECVGHPAVTLGEHKPQRHPLVQTGSFVWCCKCGARAAKFAKKLGEPCLGRPRSQEYARSIRFLSNGWHPNENPFLGSPKLFTAQAWARWRQSYHATKLSGLSSDKQ